MSRTVRQLRHVSRTLVDHKPGVGDQFSGMLPAALQRREHIMVAVQYQRGHCDLADFGTEVGRRVGCHASHGRAQRNLHPLPDRLLPVELGNHTAWELITEGDRGIVGDPLATAGSELVQQRSPGLLVDLHLWHGRSQKSDSRDPCMSVPAEVAHDLTTTH